MSRRLLIVGVLVVLLVAAGAGVVALRHRPARGARSAPVTTVVVQRGALLQKQSLPGRLGYAGARTVTGLGNGMITWLPSVGRTVQRGGQLFRVER